MGPRVLFFPVRCGLGSRFVVLSFGWAVWIFKSGALVSFLGFFPRALGVFFFLSFSALSFVGSRSARPWGWLDGVFFCFFFFFIHYISWLDIPDFVHFVFDGPLHCRKVEQRSRLHDCMQVHGL